MPPTPIFTLARSRWPSPGIDPSGGERMRCGGEFDEFEAEEAEAGLEGELGGERALRLRGLLGEWVTGSFEGACATAAAWSSSKGDCGEKGPGDRLRLGGERGGGGSSSSSRV
jgi:hypothetical protein